MKLPDFFKERKALLPILGVFSIISCFIFFMVFNFSIETLKNSREIASKKKNESNSEIKNITIAELSKVLNERLAKHSVKPTQEEQFLFGFLKGNYSVVKVRKNMIFVRLKSGQTALPFVKEAEKKKLIQKFKNIYLGKEVSLADPIENRFVASKHLSYSLIQNNTIVGRLKLKFSQEQGLLEIMTSLL